MALVALVAVAFVLALALNLFIGFIYEKPYDEFVATVFGVMANSLIALFTLYQLVRESKTHKKEINRLEKQRLEDIENQERERKEELRKVSQQVKIMFFHELQSFKYAVETLNREYQIIKLYSNIPSSKDFQSAVLRLHRVQLAIDLNLSQNYLNKVDEFNDKRLSVKSGQEQILAASIVNSIFEIQTTLGKNSRARLDLESIFIPLNQHVSSDQLNEVEVAIESALDEIDALMEKMMSDQEAYVTYLKSSNRKINN